MPVWHEAAREWVSRGQLAILGVIQEQHEDRCRLFAQWKQFDWPILHDPINVLNSQAVPIFVAIDEHGIVRSTRPQVDSFQEGFLDRTFADDAPPSDAESLTPPRSADASVSDPNSALAWRTHGDSLALWHRSGRLDEAIQAYEAAVRLAPDDVVSQFRLGVCLRMRHETERRRADDFSRAIAAWESALAGQPNQYIWRRRIQQYGPRLMKPYPFYDWVTEAEADVRARGETPIQLRVRPTGAEIAAPASDFVAEAESAVAPDPRGEILRDLQPLIETSVTVVPTQVAPGSTARVHISFVPNRQLKAHWNNEAEPLRLWVDPPAGYQVEQRLLSGPHVQQAESTEVRRLDLEVQVPEDPAAALRLSAYALYYVCEDIDGVCRFLRQDIPIEIPIAHGSD